MGLLNKVCWKEFAAKEKLEIVKVQDFGSEFLARPPPRPGGAKTVRTISRIDHPAVYFFASCPHSSTDRAWPSGGQDWGSIPRGDANKIYLFAWGIEHRSDVLLAGETARAKAKILALAGNLTSETSV